MTTDLLDDLRGWLDDNWDPDLTVGEWWERLGMAGWSTPMLTVEPLGHATSRGDALRIAAAIAAHGALGGPLGLGPGLAAPTIVTHGTDEQIERFVPDISCGRRAWCQLFSEPGAGSDLAGLATRAERDGDVWVINGQKVWTSGGHLADFGMLLARTEPTVPKHQGITWFAFDMHQPGVEVRPLKEMTGNTMFSEVFFTDAVVADADRIGDMNDGWSVANTTLFHERSGMGAGGGASRGRFARAGTVAGDLDRRAGDFVDAQKPRANAKTETKGDPGVATARTSPASLRIEVARRTGRIADPVMRQRLTQAHILGEIRRLNTERHKAVRAAGGDIPGMPNFSKLLMATILRHDRDLGLDLLGPRGMLHSYDAEDASLADSPAGRAAVPLTGQALSAQALPIFGGTDQIQRNIISERILGLPKEPGDLSRVPFNELPRS